MFTQKKRILGIDYGTVRIGLAISDELGLLAHPLETFPAQDAQVAIKHIKKLAQDSKIEELVIGLPKNMDGSLGDAAQRVAEFTQQLAATTGCKIHTWDERLTTVAAQRALRESGKNTKKSRKVIDQVAAQMILQGFLDSQMRVA